ncbi:hypothetical protein [Aeromicrobium sp. 179-A 4D2 NHS]|uniref:hypothetical protein n=1 Tax=Aeromicrobium sp. 179-A 4D2 NHS TaxID=3142375 RepID=UPI0039A06175
MTSVTELIQIIEPDKSQGFEPLETADAIGALVLELRIANLLAVANLNNAGCDVRGDAKEAAIELLTDSEGSF